MAAPAWAQTDCERAGAHYRQALEARDDAETALAHLDKATALCPNFQGWFVAGNAHRALEQPAQALAAYEQALALAEAPKQAQMARAWAALVRHRLGEACVASRAFQSLVPAGAPVPSWIREPFDAFETELAATGWRADELACALKSTEAQRSLGVCPRVAVRVEFATNSAAVDAANGAKVQTLADALARTDDGFALPPDWPHGSPRQRST